MEIPAYCTEDTKIDERYRTACVQSHLMDTLITLFLFCIDADYHSSQICECVLHVLYLLLRDVLPPLSTAASLPTHSHIRPACTSAVGGRSEKRPWFLGSAPILKHSIVPGNQPRFARNVYEDVADQFNRDSKLLEKVTGSSGVIISHYPPLSTSTLVILRSLTQPLTDFFCTPLGSSGANAADGEGASGHLDTETADGDLSGDSDIDGDDCRHNLVVVGASDACATQVDGKRTAANFLSIFTSGILHLLERWEFQSVESNTPHTLTRQLFHFFYIVACALQYYR
uniref:Ribonuclease P protein component 2 n=2 Tax=Lygus hesperus TaxID=30085 RepID=A0A0A9XJ72_LYGHE